MEVEINEYLENLQQPKEPVLRTYHDKRKKKHYLKIISLRKASWVCPDYWSSNKRTTA